MFSDQTIRKRVISVIEGRIQSAQKEYDSVCKDLDEKHLEAVKALEAKKDKEKVDVADKLVNTIIG